MDADLVFLNGTIISMDSQQPRAEAVAVARDRITAVGDHTDVADEIGPRTEVIDLAGRALGVDSWPGPPAYISIVVPACWV